MELIYAHRYVVVIYVCAYACQHMVVHMCAHMCDRYIWAHRTALARSVHDMAKQMYQNKKYSDVAWAPLREWLFNCDESDTEQRGQILTHFNKDHTEFFSVVAQCLWNLANGANVPWGRGATQTSVYALLPIHEKVIGYDGVAFFFLSFELERLIYVQYLAITIYDAHTIAPLG